MVEVILCAFGILLGCAANLYACIALIAIYRFRRTSNARADVMVPVTILKPLCGCDAGLYRNLRSFCVQEYSQFQIIFGVQSADDPAIIVVRRLMHEFPNIDIDLVIDSSVNGSNRKVSNLVNMDRRSKYAFIVIADSDMRVTPTYLSAVMAPFGDAHVGAVTCLYRGRSLNSLASAFSCVMINDWFVPSVLTAKLLEGIHFCFGSTMAVRREALDKIGGLPTLANYLADDYMLGKLVSNAGYEVKLSPYVVTNIVHERNFRALFPHELRWARTIKTVRRRGYAMSFLTNTLSVGFVAWCLVEFTLDIRDLEILIVFPAILLRVGLHVASANLLGNVPTQSIWMVPFRDVFGSVVWFASFLGNKVRWRDARFSVSEDGILIATSISES